MSEGKKECPSCGFHLYRGTHKGTKVYKCARPKSGCEWNQQWHEEHKEEYRDSQVSSYRMPIARTVPQVRRVYLEFSDQ